MNEINEDFYIRNIIQTSRKYRRHIYSLYLSFFIVISLCLFLVESFFPISVPLPGAKIGLSNIPYLLALQLLGWKACFIVAFTKPIIGSLITGTFLNIPFFFSFIPSVLSAVIMSIFFTLSRKILSLFSISIVGAISHNLTQLLIAFFLIKHIAIFFYLPFLFLFGILSGSITGYITIFLLKTPELSFINLTEKPHEKFI